MQLPDPESPHVKDAYGEVRRTPEHERETRVEVRCANCVKKLALMVTAPWRIQCPRCKMINESR